MTPVLAHALVVAAALHGVLRDVADEVGRHGLVILFVLIAAESFGSPLPGEVSLLVGAYEVHRGHFALSSVILVGVAAAIAGDNIAYLVGRRAGRPLIERLLRRFHLPLSYLERMDAYYHGHAALTVVIARQVSPLRGLAALSAGGTRVRWRRFFLANAAACTVWAVAVTVLATLLVSHLDQVEDDLSLVGASAAAAVVAVAVALLLWRRRRRAAGRRAPGGSGPGEDAPVAGRPLEAVRDDEDRGTG
jgi:membrane protein DedA with SNARE-associated domain